MSLSKTFRLKHSEFYIEFGTWRKNQTSQIPSNGVYIVKSNRPIERCLKADPEGILYIGQGNILSYNNRIGKLVNSFNGEENVHDAGSRYRMNTELCERFPISEMVIELTLTQEYIQIERDMLNNYFLTFGDVPPLNRISY